MTKHPTPGARGKKDVARVFVAGAGTGFLAGAFVVSAVVWQYGNVIGSRAANRAYPPGTPAAVERFVGGIDDAGDAIVEGVPSTVGTTGEPSPVVTPPPSPELVVGAAPTEELEARDLVIPVEGITPDQLTRSFSQQRGSSRVHEAIDILAPMHTPVHAVEAGTVARLFHSKAGGITIYQFDPSERFCYYYAHLDRYADGLKEGQQLKKGQVIGYVGVSGNAPKNTPHLHFAVFKLTGAKRWWEGTPLDPYDILK
jgi:murein DD-endopeptidase MepM/ murein hydrolase activator NlpD